MKFLAKGDKMKRFAIVTLLLSVALINACGGSPVAPATATPNPPPTAAAVATEASSAAPQTPAPAQPTLVPSTVVGTAPAQPTLAPTTAPAQPTTAPTTAPTDQPTSQASHQPTTAPTGSAGDVTPPTEPGLDVITQAAQRVYDANSVRVETLLEFADGQKSGLLVEYIKPDRAHSKGLTGGEESIIIVGKGVWFKPPFEDNWLPQSADPAELIRNATNPAPIVNALKNIQPESVQFSGVELVDGKPAFLYTYTTSDEGSSFHFKGSGKTWIGVLDRRLLRHETFGDASVAGGKQDHFLIIFTYDLPITIEPPQ
jgi:hypothetical protein